VVNFLTLPLNMSKKLTGALLLVLLGAVWGSSFILMKLGMSPRPGVNVFSHSQVASLRILIAAVVLLPFSLPSLRSLFQRHGPYFLIVGLCGNLIPSFLFTYANTELSGGISGILNSFTPVFTVLVGMLVFKTRIHWLQIVGIFVGTLGVTFLLYTKVNVASGGHLGHLSAVMCATLLYGISVNTIKHKLADVSPMEVTSLGLLSILPFALFSFLYEGTAQTIIAQPFGLEAFGYIFALGCVGTALSNIYFNRLIKMTSALFASSVTYLIPVFAVIFGSFFNEHLTWVQFFAMLVLLSGVCLVNFYDLLLQKLRKKEQVF
jgi:drug/metabolite transporter (DMT)-like permease